MTQQAQKQTPEAYTGKPYLTLTLDPEQGSFNYTVQGKYPLNLLLGHLEMFKAQVIQQAMMQAAMAQAQENAKKAEKQIILPNGPLPPRFPNMG